MKRAALIGVLLLGSASLSIIGAVVTLSPRPAKLWIESDGIRFVDLKPCLQAGTDERVLKYLGVHGVAEGCLSNKRWEQTGLKHPELRKMVEDSLAKDVVTLFVRANHAENQSRE